jgi:hypothetical protein
MHPFFASFTIPFVGHFQRQLLLWQYCDQYYALSLYIGASSSNVLSM